MSTTCTVTDNWSQGLSNYDIEYEAAFVASTGRAGVKARYDQREVAYGRGLNDFGNYAEDCAPAAEG